MRFLAALLLALSVLLAAPDASAQSCTASATELYFGNLATPLPATGVAGTVSIECDGVANETLRLCLAIAPAGGTRLTDGAGEPVRLAVRWNA